jgi:hypothetical protein
VGLEKIATGLGVALASLFDDATAPAGPVARSEGRASWRDANIHQQIWVLEGTLDVSAGATATTRR